MITKAKKTILEFTTPDGEVHHSWESAKISELTALVGNDNTVDASTVINAIVQKSREAIAILRLGLPRKPRTVKAKTPKAKKQTSTQPA